MNYNAGCGVASGKANSYGPSFNAAGGGWYAMERTDTFIRVFFWARDDTTVPNEVANGNSNIDTDSWVCLSSILKGLSILSLTFGR